MHTVNNTNLNNVGFVSVSDMLSLLQHIGTEAFLLGLVEYLEQDYLRWELFDKSPRFASHSSDGVIELMPTSDQQQFSFKYVNGHPKNTRIGLQTVTAFGVLADVQSGYPLMLSEMTILTALRTAATSAMMAKYLAPNEAKTMAMIGCGAQSEFQILAFKVILGINQVRIYDIDRTAMLKCQQNLANQGLDIILCDSAHEVVKGAEIITTCTADKRNATILTSDMVQNGVHINAIGGDCPGKTELEAALLLRADVFVEYEPQTRIEGDIQQLDSSFVVTEMYKVIRGDRKGRSFAAQLTIFDGVGFAIEDFSALRYVHDLIKQQSSHQQLELLTNQANPRDLFGLLTPATQATRLVVGA
ncbi:ornithine cyclodeaminase [Shewanella ulleungensis]|uniref:Ornithine cyclodeaminase n=1 Tax=Shewanella ulleungensis TaxID=2282699 RepID=A0ABQ2QFN5_9GAMM|nr:ornithine cyclodeaminase [Shewanella ulleungensis]MCL1148581.1 ornithine cyclodeaminase [Shewanella ulleungensis]GGP76961.1 ornithine cyclodeaminase [Shewanella ulleungensis]